MHDQGGVSFQAAQQLRSGPGRQVHPEVSRGGLCADGGECEEVSFCVYPVKWRQYFSPFCARDAQNGERQSRDGLKQDRRTLGVKVMESLARLRARERGESERAKEGKYIHHCGTEQLCKRQTKEKLQERGEQERRGEASFIYNTISHKLYIWW